VIDPTRSSAIILCSSVLIVDHLSSRKGHDIPRWKVALISIPHTYRVICSRRESPRSRITIRNRYSNGGCLSGEARRSYLARWSLHELLKYAVTRVCGTAQVVATPQPRIAFPFFRLSPLPSPCSPFRRANICLVARRRIYGAASLTYRLWRSARGDFHEAAAAATPSGSLMAVTARIAAAFARRRLAGNEYKASHPL